MATTIIVTRHEEARETMDVAKPGALYPVLRASQLDHRTIEVDQLVVQPLVWFEPL